MDINLSHVHIRQKEGMALVFTVTILFHMDSRINITPYLLCDMIATLAVTQMDHLHLAGKAYKLDRQKQRFC